ncbi:lectin like domain-containing protein [Syntrophomonas curvata]
MKIFNRHPLRSPVSPNFTKYIQEARTGLNISQKPISKEGYIPHPLDLSHLGGKKIFLGYRAEALPASFDLRSQGRMTGVKDQGPAGTCWAFATCGSMESCLLPEEEWDFSENNMKNLLAESCPEGFDRSFDGGGNQWMSTAYLARWSGPVREKDDPYDPLEGNCKVFATKKHLKRVIFIPSRKSPTDNTNIKTAIMNYGAVFSAMAYDEVYFNEQTAAYYAPEGFPNHAVTLAGWDDNYSRKKFKSIPPGDGAFIVKNSWGKNWGDQGYFYISYHDLWIGVENALFYKAESPKTSQLILQYDPLGWIAGYGFQSDTAWMANIFKADARMAINGFSLYAASPASRYSVYLYTNVGAAKPRSGKLVKTVKGTADEPSYYARNFSSPITVSQGEIFSIVVKLTTPGYNYPVPCEIKMEGISSKARSNPGQGFISDNGSRWHDIYDIAPDSSICLKAFAVKKQES